MVVGADGCASVWGQIGKDADERRRTRIFLIRMTDDSSRLKREGWRNVAVAGATHLVGRTRPQTESHPGPAYVSAQPAPPADGTRPSRPHPPAHADETSAFQRALFFTAEPPRNAEAAEFFIFSLRSLRISAALRCDPNPCPAGWEPAPAGGFANERGGFSLARLAGGTVALPAGAHAGAGLLAVRYVVI